MDRSDRVIRIVLALLAVGLYTAGIITEAFSIVLLVMVCAFLLTGFVGFCPIYRLFGLSTCAKKE